MEFRITFANSVAKFLSVELMSVNTTDKLKI